MAKLSFIKLLPALLFIAFLGSCANLKKVNSYATKSVKTLQQFEAVDYTFTQSCNNRCLIEQLEKQQLFKEDCDCKTNNDADSVTLVLYNAITGYFDGLAKLSNNELTNYKFDTTVLTQGNFGDVTINGAQVASYAKISTILLRAFTDAYRKRKIITYIDQANEPLQTLISAFNFSLQSNLSKKLEVEKERYKSYYFDLFKNASTTVYEKQKIIKEYDLVMEHITTSKKELAIFGKGLRKIAAGHQRLYNGRKKLNTTDVKALLTQCGSDLQDIDAEFNKLKNRN